MIRRRRILLIVAGLLAVTVIGVSVEFRHLSTTSSAVPVRKALTKYEQTHSASTSGPPRPGVYTYTVQGQECAGIAALRFCRAFPSQARMILIRKDGTISEEIDFSEDHLETSRFDVRPDGRYLAWQRTRIVFGIAQENAAATVPTTLALPAALRVGSRWTQHFSAGGLPVASTNQVTRRATLKIGGTSVTAYEIDASSTTGGEHPGTEDDVTWHAPGVGLDVRLIMHRRIGGAFPYTMDVDATLQSLQPLG